jgi:hypothetical protein
MDGKELLRHEFFEVSSKFAEQILKGTRLRSSEIAALRHCAERPGVVRVQRLNGSKVVDILEDLGASALVIDYN